jgi:hypothetical protein
MPNRINVLSAKRAGWSGRDAVADVNDTVAEPALVEELEVSARVARKRRFARRAASQARSALSPAPMAPCGSRTITTTRSGDHYPSSIRDHDDHDDDHA